MRVIKVNLVKNKVWVHDYHSYQNDVFDLDVAEQMFQPVFRISEVAAMFGKKTATLRKYENLGLIPEVEKFRTGSSRMTRVYTERDVWDLVEFFSTRPGPGRPSKTNVGGVDRKTIQKKIDTKKGIVNGKGR